MRNNMLNMKFKKTILLAGMSLFVNLAYAEQQIPDAGILQQQTEPLLPAIPSSGETGIKPLEQAGISDSTPFVIKAIEFKGNTKVSTDTLNTLVADLIDQEVTLTKLQAKVYEISAYYHDQGYPFARAIIPVQTIEHGTVIIEIIEAKYGAFMLNNSSRISDELINSIVTKLKPGTDIEQKSLDRALLLLNDLSGTRIETAIQPGKTVGTSDFAVNATKEDNFFGRVTMDSYGNQFINRPRLSANLNVVNLAKRGDILGVNLLTTGKRMQYGQINYDMIVNGYGTHLGGSYSAMHYELGDEVKPLGVNGRAQEGSVWVKHPFVRAKSHNLYGQVQYTHNDLEDRVQANNRKNDRTVQDVTFALNGDRHDRFMSGGVTSWRVAYTQGDVDFNNAVAQANDRASADTQGRFSKWSLNINRLQRLTNKTNVWASFTAQKANDNLDSSQKMVFGGPFSVRAYDTGAVSGDNGYLLSVEVRHDLSKRYGNWQLVGFADVGRVEVNEDRWASATGKNKDTLSGVGVGVNWSNGKNLSAKVQLATSVGSHSELTEDADKSVAWVEFSISF